MINPLAFFLEFSVLGKLLFLGAFVLVAYFGVLRAGLSLAPWVPTHRKDLARVKRICNLQPGQTYLEAGCGNARVIKYLAKEHPEVQFIGIEYSMIMVLWAKVNAFFAFLPKLKIKYGDVLESDFSEVDVVYAYGLTKTINEKLLPKAKAELQPGARFISYAFKIQDANVAIDASDTSANIYTYTQTKVDKSN